MISRPIQRWLVQLAAATVLLLAPVALLNWYGDPFHLFRDDGLYVASSRYQRFMEVGLLRQSPPIEVLVAGSSYSANFDPKLVADEFGGPAEILSIWGTSRRENIEAVELALSLHPEIDTILLERPIWGDCGTGFHPTFTFPIALYRQTPWGTLGYLLSKEALGLTWNKEFGNQNLYSRDRAIVYRWYERFLTYFGDQQNLDKLFAALKPPAKPVILSPQRAAGDIETMLSCFETSTAALAHEHPGVRFYVFNPPLMQWLIWARGQQGIIEEWTAAQEKIAERAASIANLRYFDFHAATMEVAACHHWRDMGHFDQEVSDMVVRWLAEGRYERTPQTNSSITQATRAAAATKTAC